MATFTFNADDALPGWTEQDDATLVTDSGSLNTEVYKLTETGASVEGSISQSVASATLSSGLYSVLIRVRFAGGSITSGSLQLSVGSPSSFSIEPADASGTTWAEQNTYTYDGNLYMYLGVWNYSGGAFDITIDGPTSDNDSMYFDRLILTTDDVPFIRATQMMGQALVDNDPSIRVTQQMGQALVDNDPSIRVTQQMGQALVDNDPKLRSTQQMAQALVDNNAAIRATQQVAQVLYEPELFEYLPDSDTSKGTWTASTGSDLYAMIDADDANYITSALSPSDLNDVFEVSYSTIDWFEDGYEFQIRMKFVKVDSGGNTVFGDDDEIDLTVELINSGTTLETWDIVDARGQSNEIRLYWDQQDTKPVSTTAFSIRVTANTTSPGTAHAIRIYYMGIWSKDAPLDVTPSSVSAAWSAVSPTTDIDASMSAVSAAWSSVAPTTQISTNVAADSAAWSAVAPGIEIVTSPSAAMATWSAITPSLTGELTVNVSSVSASWSAVVPAIDFSNAQSPAVANWSAVEPSLDIAASTTAVSAAWSAVAPTTDLTASVTALSAAWSAVGPTTQITTSVSADSAAWSAVAPGTEIATTPSAGMATWSAITPSLTGELTVNVSSASATWSAVLPSKELSNTPNPVVATWSAVEPGLAIDTSATAVSATWSAVVPAIVTTNIEVVDAVVATWSAVAPTIDMVMAIDPEILVWSSPNVAPEGPDPDTPTEFERRRVPGSRLGSGIMKTIFPSQQVRTSLTERRATHHTGRMRRHIAKGFSDNYASDAYDSTVINAISTWDGTSDQLINVLEYSFPNVSTPSATLGLCAPAFAGQHLIINLNDTFAQSLTFNTALCIGAPSFKDGATSYTQIALSSDGANIHLVGLNEADTLKWFVVSNNGASLS